MIDDARGYFSVEVSPLKLQEKGCASYPKSHMGSVCEAVFNHVELNRKNFPRQWMTASPRTDERRSSGSGSNARLAALSQKLDRLLGERKTGATTPSSSKGKKFDMSELNNAFTEMMGDYHKKFKGAVLFKKILEHAGVAGTDLPTLPQPAYNKKGKSNICWASLLGKCSWQRSSFSVVT